MAYAIFKTGGKQYRVEAGDKIDVEKLDADVGDTVKFEEVLASGNGADIQVGAPFIDGAAVTAKVVDHPKGDKVLTFKYRPTRRMRRRVGFRHAHTRLEIVSIDV